MRAGHAVRLRRMAGPAPEVIAWASAILGAEVTVLRGLRHGSSPWLLRAGDREVVLRVARAEQAPETATEAAAMTYAARVAGASLPVAELLGYDLAVRTGYGLLLAACVPGTSAIPPEPDPARLRALGAAAARISSVKLTATPALPVRAGRSRPTTSPACAATRGRRICSARPRRRWPRPGRTMTGLAWCMVTCGMATRCGTTTG